MKRLLFLFLLGCGSDQFANDAGPDSGGDGIVPTSEGGGGSDGSDAGGDAAMMPKPRLFASVIGTSGSSQLLAWDDPDSIATPRQADVSIGIDKAYDVAVVKRARVYVAGGPNIYSFDKPLELTSSSMPKTFDKGAFLGLGQNDVLTVMQLSYEPMADMLATTDNGPAQVQLFANAATAMIPPTAQARFAASMDAPLYSLLAPNGELYVTTQGTRSLFVQGATGTSGPNNMLSNFFIGAGRMAISNGRLFMGGMDYGVGGAALYVYQHPVTVNMASWIAEVHGVFGGPGQSYNTQDVATSGNNWVAAGVWKVSNGSDCYICVFSNPGSIDMNSTCANKIVLNMNETLIRMFERKGSLYVSVGSMAGSRIDIYRNPMSDTKPTVKLDVGTSRFATGLGVAE